MLSIEFAGELDGVDQRRDAEGAEGAIDETPPDGDFANRPTDEGEGEDEDGGPDAHVEDAFIADGIAVGEDEEEHDHEVCEGEPIGAVADEGVVGIGDIEPLTDLENPVGEAFMVSRVEVGTSASEDGGNEVEFVEKGKGGDPTQEQAKHDDNNRKADLFELSH